MIDLEDLTPETYYWARSVEGSDIEIVQISNVFDRSPEFWTVAVMGSDQHQTLTKFHYLKRIERPVVTFRNV